MKKLSLLMLLIAVTTAIYATGQKQENSTEVIVFAAASTSDIIEEAGLIYFKKTGVEIKLNPASSGTCAKQLEQGAFTDIFISASGKWIDYTNELGLLSEYSSLMSNGLVIISPADTEIKPFVIYAGKPAPLFEGYLSIADPEHAPAGKYAVEALLYMGWYEELSDRILPGADVRKALSVVEFGESELGIVYKTDAEKSKKVKTISVFPEESHSPIRYYCGLTKEASDAGADFYKFLTSDSEMAVLIEKYGFSGHSAE